MRLVALREHHLEFRRGKCGVDMNKQPTVGDYDGRIDENWLGRQSVDMTMVDCNLPVSLHTMHTYRG